jgi:hypothetical protein
VKYGRFKLDGTGKNRLPDNSTRSFEYPKTLYDNRSISDNEIFRYGQIAAAKGYNRYVTKQFPNGRTGKNVYNTLSGGVWFDTSIGNNGQITNHYPIFPKSYNLISTGLTTLP